MITVVPNGSIVSEGQETDVQNDKDGDNIQSDAPNGDVTTENPIVEVTPIDKPANGPADDAILISRNSRQSSGSSASGSASENNDIASASVVRQRDNARRTRSPNKTKQDQVKRFICKRCKYGTNIKGNLNLHKKTHAREKLMGLKRNDEDGKLHCTSCTLTFRLFKGYCAHMKKNHNG